jgi:tetratricopeptide (TPR) repeat protein
VCTWGEAQGHLPAGAEVLEGVSRLVDLHLLQMGISGEGYAEGEPRFSMLATIQEFGREQLETTDEFDAVQRRHAMYFLTLADSAVHHLLHHEVLLWLERLEEELDNLRAAWAWCLVRGQAGEQEAVERGMWTAGYLCEYYALRSHHQEALTWLERFLAVPVARARTRGRAAALWCLAYLRAHGWGDLSAAEPLCEECTAIARELGDQKNLAHGLFCWGIVCGFLPRPSTDDLIRARAYLEEAATLFEALGDEDSRAYLAGVWECLGVALIAAGELSEAETRLAKGVELATATGDRYYVGLGLGFLGNLAAARGDLPGARVLLEQSLLQHEALGDRGGLVMMLGNLGDVLQRSGDLLAARAHYARALRMVQARGRYGVWGHRALCGLAELASATGEPARALKLVSVATALAKEDGLQPGPPEQARLQQVEAAARRALTPEAQTAAWTAGQAMSMEEVIAEALGTGEMGPL